MILNLIKYKRKFFNRASHTCNVSPLIHLSQGIWLLELQLLVQGVACSLLSANDKMHYFGLTVKTNKARSIINMYFGELIESLVWKHLYYISIYKMRWKLFKRFLALNGKYTCHGKARPYAGMYRCYGFGGSSLLYLHAMRFKHHNAVSLHTLCYLLNISPISVV